MGPPVWAEIDDAGFGSGGEVDDGDGVAAFAGVLHPEDAVVGDVERVAVEGADDFVGVDADFDFGRAFAGGGVEADFAADFFDDGEVWLSQEETGEEEQC